MIDARYLDGKDSGIGRYTQHLVRHLLRIDQGLRLRLVTHPKNPIPVVHPRVSTRTFRAAPNSLSTRFLLSRVVDFRGVHLFHSPFNILPADLPVPAVFTLHDVMWLLDPSYCTSRLWKRLVTGTFYRAFIPRSVDEADAVLTVSEHSRDAIAGHFPQARGRIDVSYNGLDPFFRPLPAERAWPLLARWMAPRTRFVLTVGQGSPYKNHVGALRAFRRAFADDPRVYFVLLRRLKGRADAELRRLLDDRRLNSRVLRLDYVSAEELRALYSMARVFLFPSLYEGFGLPAIEAMACDTPVITSDRGAPYEVCADAALSVDPTDTDAMADALRRLFGDEALRRTLRQRGRRRIRHFQWSLCARRTLTTYRRILNASE